MGHKTGLAVAGISAVVLVAGITVFRTISAGQLTWPWSAGF
jgi:hypothetical protein